MFERAVLIFSAIVWLPYGVYCFLQPDALAESAGIVAATATGTTELRAMYGGAQIAIGALAVAALIRSRLASGVLLTLLFVTGGLASTRLLGVALDGEFTGYTAFGLGFEGLSAVLALVALSRGRPGAAAH